MVDREQLETLLANRFPGATREQIAAAANAIMAMTRPVGNPADDGRSLRTASRRARHRNCVADPHERSNSERSAARAVRENSSSRD